MKNTPRFPTRSRRCLSALAVAVFGLGWGSVCAAADGPAGADNAGPVFVYDYGWFRDYGTSDARCYECWNVKSAWADVPDRLRSRSWLILYVAPKQIYSSQGPNTGTKQDIEPRPDPDYAKKDAALERALEDADKEGIGIVLMVRRWCKSAAAAPSYDRIDEACRRHACVKGLLYSELGSHQFSAICQEHVQRFTAIAKKHGKKAFWAAFMSRDLALWNFLMSEPIATGSGKAGLPPPRIDAASGGDSGPKTWLSFLKEYGDTLVPTWKNVEPSDNMLNWADCLGLWLSGTTTDWGFMFDSCYWPQYIGAERKGQRGRRKYWSEVYPEHGEWFTAGTCGCPSYLVKDTMILAALTGCRYFQFERFKPFEPGGSLRPVRDKTAGLILDRRLTRTQEEVRSVVRVAVETPAKHADFLADGFSHTYTDLGPNVVWKSVFHIDDFGFDVIPNEGRYYTVPVVPPQTPATDRLQVVKAEEAARPGRLDEILAQRYPQRFVASDPHVLIFDAGDIVYLTDCREDDRTTLDFTLESKVPYDARCTFLNQDCTASPVRPATEDLPHGWRKRFVIFPGCSVLIEKQKKVD